MSPSLRKYGNYFLIKCIDHTGNVYSLCHSIGLYQFNKVNLTKYIRNNIEKIHKEGDIG